MELHRNARLGLSGRFAAGAGARARALGARGGATFQRLAGHREPMVVSLAGDAHTDGALHPPAPVTPARPTGDVYRCGRRGIVVRGEVRRGVQAAGRAIDPFAAPAKSFG
jgi:hypothetical protein